MFVCVCEIFMQGYIFRLEILNQFLHKVFFKWAETAIVLVSFLLEIIARVIKHVETVLCSIKELH